MVACMCACMRTHVLATFLCKGRSHSRITHLSDVSSACWNTSWLPCTCFCSVLVFAWRRGDEFQNTMGLCIHCFIPWFLQQEVTAFLEVHKAAISAQKKPGNIPWTSAFSPCFCPSPAISAVLLPNSVIFLLILSHKELHCQREVWLCDSIRKLISNKGSAFSEGCWGRAAILEIVLPFLPVPKVERRSQKNVFFKCCVFPSPHSPISTQPHFLSVDGCKPPLSGGRRNERLSRATNQ